MLAAPELGTEVGLCGAPVVAFGAVGSHVCDQRRVLGAAQAVGQGKGLPMGQAALVGSQSSFQMQGFFAPEDPVPGDSRRRLAGF